MRTFIFLVMCVVALLIAMSALQAAESTNSFACPPGYAMTIDPPPAPKDDPPKQENYKPKTAAEKQAEAAREQAEQMARARCVPMGPRQ